MTLRIKIMPAKDVYHDNVRNALLKDHWIITDDPLRLTWGKREFFADLGAKKLIAAEKDERKIAIKVKFFFGLIPSNRIRESFRSIHPLS